MERAKEAPARESAGGVCSSWQQLWRHVEARGGLFGPEIFRFCRLEAVEHHGIVGFLKSWANLHRFEGFGRGSFLICGGMWRRVQPFLGLKFLGFVDRGLTDLVVPPIL